MLRRDIARCMTIISETQAAQTVRGENG